MWFSRIKRFYENGLWTKEQYIEIVAVGKITIVEYEDITGEVYVV